MIAARRRAFEPADQFRREMLRIRRAAPVPEGQHFPAGAMGCHDRRRGLSDAVERERPHPLVQRHRLVERPLHRVERSLRRAR